MARAPFFFHSELFYTSTNLNSLQSYNITQMDSLSIPEVSFHSNLSSEVDSTSNLPSTANSYNTRGRSAHETWDHTRPTEPSEPTHDAKGVRLLYCKYCTTKSCYASAVTTNFRRHVSTKHNITIGASTSRMETQIVTQLENLMKDAKLSGRTAEINSHLLREYLDQRTIGDSLVSLVVLRNLSHRIVEWPEFHVLCRCLNPSASSVLPASHSHMGKLIGNSFFPSKGCRTTTSPIGNLKPSFGIRYLDFPQSSSFPWCCLSFC